MKKYLLYGGAFLGSLVLINVGIYFFLSATQPKTAMLTESDSLSTADSLTADSALAHGEASLTDSSLVADLPEQSEAIKTESKPVEEVKPADTAPENVNAAEAALASAESDLESALDAEAGAESEAESTSQEVIDGAMQGDPKQLAKLAKLMDGMKPLDSAAIASRLPVDTIVTLIMKMKDRSAAKMMASLPVDQAARVAIRMSELASGKPS